MNSDIFADLHGECVDRSTRIPGDEVAARTSLHRYQSHPLCLQELETEPWLCDHRTDPQKPQSKTRKLTDYWSPAKSSCDRCNAMHLKSLGHQVADNIGLIIDADSSCMHHNLVRTFYDKDFDLFANRQNHCPCRWTCWAAFFPC